MTRSLSRAIVCTASGCRSRMRLGELGLRRLDFHARSRARACAKKCCTVMKSMQPQIRSIGSMHTDDTSELASISAATEAVQCDDDDEGPIKALMLALYRARAKPRSGSRCKRAHQTAKLDAPNCCARGTTCYVGASIWYSAREQHCSTRVSKHSFEHARARLY